MLLHAHDLIAELTIETANVRVLDRVELAVASGEVVDIVGPSGSGKSTLLRALAQLLPSASGTLVVDGRSADSMRAQEWRRLVTLLPQKPVIMPGTVRENLAMPWRLKIRTGEPRPTDETMLGVLEMLQLSGVGLDRDAARLSVGQQSRLGFARVWLASPQVLLLDEADAALDDDSTAAMSAAVSRFAEQGGPTGVHGRSAVVRVRHRGDDGVASRRLRLLAGRLEAVST